MASQAQVLANRTNAQSSTGPQSPEGKAASSQNAAKHGLSSAFAVLQHEDQDEFDVMLACLREEHHPQNSHQAFLVDQLAVSQWQLARAQRLQNMAFDHLAGAQPGPADPDARIIAEMFKTNPNAIATLDRYAARAERSYHKTYKELKIAKQIQTEANIVGIIDSRPTLQPGAPSNRVQSTKLSKPPVQNEPNPAKPSLRSTYPENLGLCL